MTFNLFPHLPFELREMIWKAAIRPQGRGVQFFTFTEPSKHTLEGLAVLASDTVKAKKSRLTISLDNNTSNVSTCLIDSGLWTACYESRMILQREFEKRRRFGPDERTGHFTSNGLDRYFTYYPGNDLVCFQNQDIKKLVQWEWKDVYQVQPFLRAYHVDVALENRKTIQGDVFRACHKVATGKLWLIDYRAQPKADISEEQKKHVPEVTFYANRKRFVAVDDEQMWDFQGSACYAVAQRLDATIQAWYQAHTAYDKPDLLWRTPNTVDVIACID